jgi:hypothetical protein
MIPSGNPTGNPEAFISVRGQLRDRLSERGTFACATALQKSSGLL